MDEMLSAGRCYIYNIVANMSLKQTETKGVPELNDTNLIIPEYVDKTS